MRGPVAAGIAGGFGGFAGGQAIKGGLHCSQVVEGVEAVGAAAKLAWGLRTAEHQEAKNGGLVAAEIEDGADAVLILGHAAVADRGDERYVFERVKCLTDFVFGKVEDGISAGALIARIDQCIERKRVVLRRGDLFFDERAENADLDGVERHIL